MGDGGENSNDKGLSVSFREAFQDPADLSHLSDFFPPVKQTVVFGP